MKSYAAYINHEDSRVEDLKITVQAKDEESARATVLKIVEQNFEGWSITKIVDISS